MTSQEREKIESETNISFAGKGIPMFKKQTKAAPVEKTEEEDIASIKMNKKMSEGVGRTYG